MIFIVFTIMLWLIALFHIWDHRRFEQDLAALAEGKRDWRAVALPAGVSTGEAYRRALMIHSRADFTRYAVPVLFFVVLLLGVKSPVAAALYLAVIVIKWFVSKVVLYRDEGRYEIYLLHQRVFAAALP